MKNSAVQRLTGKDFVAIGIYSVLIRVIVTVVGMLFMPFMVVAFPFITGACVLVAAPVYLLMAYKVGKRGVMFLFCTIIGLTYVLMGAVYILPYMLIAGILCEAVMWKKGSYRSFWHNAASYSVYSVLYLGAMYFPICVFGKEYFVQFGLTQEGTEILAKYVLTPSWAAISILITVLMALAGCLIGRRLLKKHFIKSGLVTEV